MYLFFLQEQQVNQLNYELSSKREEYISINTKLENDLREANENIANQVNYFINFCFIFFDLRLLKKQEIERLDNESKEIKSQLTEQINQLEKDNLDLKQTFHQQEELSNEIKLQLDVVQKEKDEFEEQLQSNQQIIDESQRTITQLHTELDEKVRKKNIDFAYLVLFFLQ
jgi:cell shape-determining protein MreC